jgi:predicted ATPase/DNA-binding winged helix-turn-helix (wHTH) protein
MHSSYRFGRCELDPDRRQLLIDGSPTALGGRAFDVLLALVERREQLVTKDELLELAWPGLVVEENNLQVQISSLRKVLGPQVIATIPGRGYRFAALLEGAGDRDAGLRDSKVAAKGAAAEPARLTNLAKELPPLYGRDADLAALRSLLDGQRLVTIVGAGGIGKSRLAEAAAHALVGRWPDGVWIIELAGLSDRALVPNAVARTLNVPIHGHGTALDDLVGGVAQRRLLLVLDNCEHLLDAAGALAQAILKSAPDIHILATSQEPLHLPDEQQYRVSPLAVPDVSAVERAREFGAVALFEARVRAVNPGLAMNDESLALVTDICRRLDGLPLAIELAAARVATIGLRPVRDKLDERFKLLTGGSRATLRRHQTLRAALEWSHNLLTDAERTVFRRLGVFAGGFTMEMAQALAAGENLDEWAVLEHLSALIDKSLVAVDAGDPPRYRLLESSRAFALEQLAAGETAQMLRRHAQAMRTFLERIDGANLDGELRTDQYAARVLPELDNLRAAHAWAAGEDGDPEVAFALAVHAGSLIDYAQECADWIDALPEPGERAMPDVLAVRYFRAIAAGNMSGRTARPRQLDAAIRARSMYDELGKPRRAFAALMQVARHRWALKDLAGAQAAIDEARAQLQPDWPVEFRIFHLRIDGYVAQSAGRSSEAVKLYRECAAVSAASGDWRLEVMARSNVADLLWQLGRIEEAAAEATRVAEEVRKRPPADADSANLFANLLGILTEMGRIDDAAAVAREALEHMRRAGEYFVEEWAYFFWRRGRLEDAAQLAGASDAVQARTGVPPQPNELRLMLQVRASLEAQLAADVLAHHFAAGAVLGTQRLYERISGALP